MLILVLLFLLLPEELLSGCSRGCLRCKVGEDRCEFCDFTLNYFDSEGTGSCRRTLRIQNCEIQKAPGVCLQCSTGFFWNSTHCIVFSSEQAEQNCLRFGANSTCIQCQPAFYWNTKYRKCLFVEIPVEGCVRYSTSQTCVECEAGLQRSHEGLSCVPLQEIEHCRTYQSFLRCVECGAGYLGVYRYTLVDEPTVILAKTMVRPACAAGLPVTGCTSWDLTGNCASCPIGQVVRSGKCIRALASGGRCISSDAKGCISCVGEITDGECRASVGADIQCARSLRGECVECRKGYYLSRGRCSTRVKSVDCLLPAEEYDFCFLCMEGRLRIDGACLSGSPPANCLVPAATLDNNLYCARCARGFFYSAGTKRCETGQPISNCEVWLSEGECAICAELFALEAGVCVPAASGCAVSSNGGCIECRKEFLALGQPRGCAAAVEPQGIYDRSGSLLGCDGMALDGGHCVVGSSRCAEVASGGACGKCRPGFARAGTDCRENVLEAKEGCAEPSDEDRCSQCEAGLGLTRIHSTGKCVTADGDCLQMNSQGDCIFCRDGLLASAGRCEPQPAASSSATYGVSGCLHYSYDRCLACEDGMMRSADGTSCVTAENDCLVFLALKGGKVCLRCLHAARQTSGVLYSVFDGFDSHLSPIFLKSTPRVCGLATDCGASSGFGENTFCELGFTATVGGESRLCCTRCRAGYGGTLREAEAGGPSAVDGCRPLRGCNEGLRVSLQVLARADFDLLSCNGCLDPEETLTISSALDHDNLVCEALGGGSLKNCLIARRGEDSTTTCLVCRPGFAMDGALCRSFNCLRTSIVNYCEECESGFVLTQDYRSCLDRSAAFLATKVDPNCAVIDTASTDFACLRCLDGFALNSNACLPARPRGCLSASGRDCRRCQPGFAVQTLRENEQLFACLPLAEPLPGCELHAEPGICAVCSSGFAVAANRRGCFADSLCGLYDAEKKKCLRCPRRHFARDLVCVPGAIAHCDVYASSRICTACETGFAPAVDKRGAIRCVTQPAVPHCAKLGPSGCEICETGFSPVVSAALHCLLPPADAICAYRLDDLSCLECAEGFFAAKGGCLPRKNWPIDGCLLPSPNSDSCGVCRTGLSLSFGGICEPAGWVDARCLAADGTGSCIECSLGYYLNRERRCEPFGQKLVPYCGKTDSAGSCYQCRDGTLPDSGGACAAPPTFSGGCLRSSVAGDCDLCPPGRYPVGSDCLVASAPPTNCRRLSAAKICADCEKGYYASPEGDCRPIPIDELRVAASWNHEDPFFSFPGIDTCSKFELQLDPPCLFCQTGYYLNAAGTCDPCLDKLCYLCDVSIGCIFCSPGSHMDNSGKCMPNFLQIKTVLAVLAFVFLV